MQHPHEQAARRHVHEHDRHLQRSDGRTENGEQRCGQPCLHGEHVLRAVDEHGERAPFGDVLGHQSIDGLVGIEAGLFPPQEHGAACEDERGRHPQGGHQRPFGGPQVLQTRNGAARGREGVR